MLNSQTAQIDAELYQREAFERVSAQQSIAHFGQYIYPWYTAYEMHYLVAFYLEQVILFLQTGGKEGIENLIVLTPPQHGKSELISRIACAWALGKLPDLRILLGSYGADLASESSREVRNIVLTDEYQAVFGGRSSLEAPVVLSHDSRGVAKWDLAKPHRGGMLATGVGGAFSGRAKGLFIGDDLFKDHRQAESEDYRNDVWDWYRSSVLTRAKAKIIVMTHWHPDDIAGRLMKQMIAKPRADQWVIVALPGIALEPGEYAQNREEQRQKMLEGVYLPLKDPLDRKSGDVLCPAMMTLEQMLKIKESSEDYFFSALYQQTPYAKEGQKYKREWFKVVTKLPDGVTIRFIVRYWDKANSTGGDYTVGVLMAYCSDGYFYILNVVRGRWTSYERDQKMKKTAESDRTRYGNVQIWHQQDPGSAGLDSAQATNRVFMGFPAFFETMTGSKETRSEPLESAFQGRLVFLLQGDWVEAFIDEFCAFPRGKYDDQVDAASSAYSKLLEMIDEPEVQEDQVVFYEERVSISPV